MLCRGRYASWSLTGGLSCIKYVITSDNYLDLILNSRADVPPLAAIFAIGSDKQIPQLPEKFSLDARNFVNACLTRSQCTRPNATQLLLHPFIIKKISRKK